MEPNKGTFKIQTVGPMKSGTSKKGNPWRSFQLQFEGDNNWYDTFWMNKDDPQIGTELTGTKSYDDQFKSYKFELERGAGKSNWNPAGAQATVMAGAAQVVHGFFAISPAHYALWTSAKEEDAKKLKTLFDKYVVTVEAVAKRLKDSVVGMGSMQAEQKTGTKPATSDGDPGPTPPPEVDGWPEGEEEQSL